MNKEQENSLGMLLKAALNERSLSLRKFSELTNIDVATISRIINGKRKATPMHLQTFADRLGIAITELFAAAGYAIDSKSQQQDSEMLSSINMIQSVLESSGTYDKPFTIQHVERELEKYQQYANTDEGQETILNGFEAKLKKVGSIGPFINQLKNMFQRFRLKRGTSIELSVIGGALLYFIFPVDVVPDYIFPIGYLDDAIAVKLVLNVLETKL
ncbi:transcriptional regulator [Pullulanibacillus camelliae]|uniref:Transcriptional regulator n=1 Tax=Pullulanibacillus camelliae TaxID=1707096 RepID=A0A8J2VMW2_9BACL|nr:DUF1232 domain-containing protein [Pullulanibacillus camelliae]GGE39263.1 transcriptional regulator [Pullulanibacillus camelliae]